MRGAPKKTSLSLFLPLDFLPPVPANTFLVALVVSLFALLPLSQAQAANVNAGIGYTNAFSSQPLAADWTTRSFGSGFNSANDVVSREGLNTSVQTNSASLFSAQCASATGAPPNPSSTAVWSPSGYLQTRPTSVAATLLMARLVNNTGTNATAVHISYDYTNRTSTTEEVPGHLVYYSLTGAANTWSNIAELTQAPQGVLSVDLTLSGVWSNGATLYLLWADDNGSPSPDTAQDIDNFFTAVIGTAIMPSFCTLNTPANGQSFGAIATVNLSASAAAGEGATLTGVGFYELTGGFVGTLLTPPYTLSTNLDAGTYSFYAVATNSLCAVMFSATNTITITNIPLSVALTSPIHSAVYGPDTIILCQAVPTPGSSAIPIDTVSFYMLSNGTTTLLFTDTSPPYFNQLSGLAVGSYAFFAVVTNATGQAAFSSTNLITVSSIANGLVIRGPYLGSRGETNITIRWRTTEASFGRVRYGTSPDNLTGFADDAASGTNHSVSLGGLAQETKYYYSIGTTAGTLLASTNYYFFTAPPTGANRFSRLWFLSDYGGSDSTQLAVRNSYLNFIATNGHATDVWFTGGDNQQSGYGADALFQTSVFNVYSNVFQNTPIFPTCGNHDGDASSAYWTIFSEPMQGECGGYPSGSQHFYSYDYANIHFISLDAYNYGASHSAQLRWLTNDLAQTTQQWIIAYWHEPPYCKNFYDSDTDSSLKATRENFNPVLETYGVDLVLSGHCHSLQRTYLINQHYGISTTFSATNLIAGGDGRIDGDGPYLKTNRTGTVYATAPAGCGLAHPGSGTMPAFAETLSYTLYGCLVIDVNSNRLDFQMMTSSGSVGDYFTILKPASQGVMQPLFFGTPQLSNGVFTMAFQGTPGVTYTLQSADALNNSWLNRTNVTVPPEGVVLLHNDANGSTNRFYRLIYPAQ